MLVVPKMFTFVRFPIQGVILILLLRTMKPLQQRVFQVMCSVTVAGWHSRRLWENLCSYSSPRGRSPF